MQLQLNILPLLNWLDFCFKALLSSYSVMCSPWRPLSVIESPVKSKLTTTNYLSPWKLHLYYKIDGDLSDISRTNASKHGQSLGSALFTQSQVQKLSLIIRPHLLTVVLSYILQSTHAVLPFYERNCVNSWILLEDFESTLMYLCKYFGWLSEIPW